MDYKFTYGLNKDAKDIRQKVFCDEQGFKNEFDDIDAIAYHLVIYQDDLPVATGRVFLQDQHYYLGRIAVIKEKRKQKLGSFVISLLEEKVKELNGKEIVLHAQTRAKDFYKTLGYQEFGEEFFDEYCPHIAMKKTIL